MKLETLVDYIFEARYIFYSFIIIVTFLIIVYTTRNRKVFRKLITEIFQNSEVRKKFVKTTVFSFFLFFSTMLLWKMLSIITFSYIFIFIQAFITAIMISIYLNAVILKKNGKK